MQVTEKLNEGLRREYEVVIAASEIEDKVSNRLSELKDTVKIPGFRPGKVPMSLLRKRFGKSIMGEILETSVRDTSTEAITEKDIRPAMQPKITVTSFKEGSDLEYKMEVEVLPEIKPIDFATLTFDRPVVKVGDDEIASTIDRLASDRKTFEATDPPRASVEGDQVVIDFDGTVDGKSREGLSASDFSLELGKGLMIPGFEDQLIGASAGESKTVEVSFPDEYGVADLAGKPAVFEVQVKEVQAPVDKPLDDEFAKEMGAESVDDLRSKITERLEQQYSSVSRDRVKRVLLDRLAEETGFDLPTGMVDQEFEGIWQQVEQQREQNPDEEEFQRPDEELRQEYRDIAARRVRIGLILSDVARAQEITVNQDELGQAVLTQARQFPGQEKEVFEYYRNNPQATEQLRAPILEDKVVDYILELAEITDKDVEIEELMRDPDEAAAEEKAEKKPAKKTAAKKSAKAADEKKPAAKKAAASKKSSTKSAAKSKATSESDG